MLQALAQRNLLRQVDYLSTVSGGGYIGSFLGRLYTRVAAHDQVPFRRELTRSGSYVGRSAGMRPAELVESVVADSFSPPIQWLRENGRYLSPNGAGDTLIGVSVMLRNWFAVRFVLWTAILLVFIWINAVRCAIAWDVAPSVAPASVNVKAVSEFAEGSISVMNKGGIWWSPLIIIPFILLLVWMLPVGWGYWLFPVFERNDRRVLFLLANVIAIAFLMTFPGVINQTSGRPPSLTPVLTFLGGLAGSGVVAFLITRHRGAGIRQTFELTMRLLTALIGVLIVLYAAVSDDTRNRLASLVCPWQGDAVDMHYTWGGLLSAALLIAGMGGLLWLTAGRPSRRKPVRISRLCLAMLGLTMAGILGGILSPAAAGVWLPDAADCLCAAVVLALWRSAIPDHKIPNALDVPLVAAITTMAIVLAIGGLAEFEFTLDGIDLATMAATAAAAGGLALMAACEGTRIAYREERKAGSLAHGSESETGRNELSAWLKNGLILVFVAAVFGVLDSLGQTIYALYAAAEYHMPGSGLSSLSVWFLSIASAVLAAVMASRRLATSLLGKDGAKRIKLRWEIVAFLVAITLAAIELVAINAVGHAIAWGGAVPAGNPGAKLSPELAAIDVSASSGGPGVASQMSILWLLPIAVFLLLLAWAQGQGWTFLNRSSFSSLYAARLTRAYLGASNPRRWRGPEEAVTRVVDGDGATLGEYLPHRAGGPLHLINVTINETASGRSQIEQRDRKGHSLVFGPHGASVHRQHHALWNDSETGMIVSTSYGETEAILHRLERLLWGVERFDGVKSQQELHELRLECRKSILKTCHGLTRRLDARPQIVAALSVYQSSLEDIVHVLLGVNSGSITVSDVRRAAASIRDRIAVILSALRASHLTLSPISPEQSAATPAGGVFRVFETADRDKGVIDCEDLPVALAMTISGAAFTTGLGSRTSLGLSLLCGLLNVRLGYWWNSGINPGDRSGATRPTGLSWLEWQAARLFPVQTTLFQEFLGRFHGPARRHWYLSDGGHYENLGAYELIRRRVPWIVISDAEADPEYTFDGLAKLIRTVRIDFGAEIEFLTEAELDLVLEPALRKHFGTSDQLRRGRWSDEPVDDPHLPISARRLSMDVATERLSLRHAALAWVRYPDTDTGKLGMPQSVIVYCKPTLNGDEPEDVRKYHADHAKFPQETTTDQFFDEAQWESYRQLGEHIGRRVFDGTIAGWLQSASSEAATPTSLYAFVDLIENLNHEADSGRGFRVTEQSNRLGRFLVLENRVDRIKEYRLHAREKARFAGGAIILRHINGRWQDSRSDNALAGDCIQIPGQSTLVIQEEAA